MSVYQEIQRCKALGSSKAGTARQLGLARGTVRKFWKMSRAEYQRFCKEASRRRQRFDGYREEIIEIVELGESDGVRVYGSSLYDVLQERHGKLPGSERTLGNYLRMLRDTGVIGSRRAERVRRPQEESEPGRQCQVDFGEYRLSSGKKAYIFAAVLANSRMRYVGVQDHRFCTREVIGYVLESFRFFGGRVRELAIDQDKLMTVSENGGEIVHTGEFQQFLDEQELGVWLCRKADPASKGKIENTVKFVKTSFFSARRFEEVEEIHEPLERWLARRANGSICQATGRIPAVVLEKEERAALRAVRASMYDEPSQGEGEQRKADRQGMISFEGNRYSVPAEYAGCTVRVARRGSRVMVFDSDSGERIASHRRAEGKGHTCVAVQHRIARGQKAEQGYAELAGGWEGRQWREFVAQNQRHYRRYWKEQVARLRRIVEEVEEPGLFEQALEFCLDSESYGASQLRDAYRHLREAAQLAVEPLLEQAKPIMASRRELKGKVAKRAVGYYSSLVSLLVAGGGR